MSRLLHEAGFLVAIVLIVSGILFCAHGNWAGIVPFAIGVGIATTGIAND